MENLELLVKSLNKLENYTAKYIYKKYIETAIPETTIPETTTPETTTPESSTPEQLEITFKYSKKPNNNEDYKVYEDTIFDKERKYIIKQNIWQKT